MCSCEIFEKTTTKNINPQQKQVTAFNKEKPDEASGFELPLNNNIPHAKVHTKAASRRSKRFDTVHFITAGKFICTINSFLYIVLI
jgi:hypothetical protein